MTMIILAVLFFLFLLMGMPIAIAIGGASLVSILAEGQLPGLIVPQRVFVMLDSFSLMAVPIFILAGEAMSSSGITNKIVKFASTMIGHVRAGLAKVTILASMIMAGISGAAAADASAIGSIMIPAMEKDGYEKDVAVSVVSTANTIGPIIPPSIMMIIYGSMTSVSIGAMFLGGIIPGILFGLGLMAITHFITKKRGYKTHPKASIKERLIAFKDAIWALIMPIIIVGGILSGIFTATESGVIAVVYAFVIGFVNGSIKIKDVPGIFKKAAISTTIPMFIIGIASIFGWILARNNFPRIVGSFLMGISTNPTVFLLIIVAFLLIIGMFMEDTAAMIIMVPVIAPIALAYGISPIHFGVLTVVTLLIGTVTPPVGVLLFICCSIAGINLSQVSKTIWKFIPALMLIVVLMALIPDLVMFLPRLFGIG